MHVKSSNTGHCASLCIRELSNGTSDETSAFRITISDLFDTKPTSHKRLQVLLRSVFVSLHAQSTPNHSNN